MAMVCLLKIALAPERQGKSLRPDSALRMRRHFNQRRSSNTVLVEHRGSKPSGT